MRVLSVDLGTSNTVAVLSAHGRAPRVVDVDGASMMPSAVFATEDGTLVAGREAERRARLDPSRFEPNPKRRVDEGTLLLGDRVVPVTDALAAVLRKVAEETARQLGGSAPDEVRLTHPAQWGPVRRNVLLSAARQAGMGSNLVLVPEPVAAAAHFATVSTGGMPPDPRAGSAPTPPFPGQGVAPGQALAVYDLGAGTFDVAVVAATQNGFAVLAEAGLPDLGGLDVDQALLQHVGQQVVRRDPAGWQRLLMPASTTDRRAGRAVREDVRAAKEALSSHPQTDLPLPEPFDDVLVTRIELESLIRPNLMRSVELLSATIRATGLGPDRLRGIYLVGGSSRIPLVGKLISEQLRVVPSSLDQPETAVALGAHHVSREGVLLGTANLAAAPAQVTAAPTHAATPPPSHAAPPPQAGQPHAGPLPHATPSPQAGQAHAAPLPHAATPPQAGPPSHAGPHAGPPHPMAHPPVAQYPGSPGYPPRRRSPLPWLIGAGAAVVVGVVVLVIVLSGSDGGGGGGGNSPGGGGGTASGAGACADKSTRDGQGYTPCLKEFIGSVTSRAECESSGPSGSSVVASAQCRWGDEQAVNYAHYSDMRTMQQQLRTNPNTEGAQAVNWSGGGLSGQYQVGKDGKQLAFWVTDRPVAGYLVTGSRHSPEKLVELFDKQAKPGS